MERAIVETSRREGIGLNKAAHRLLELSLRKQAENSDFDEFCGRWSNSDAGEFDAALSQIRRMDPADRDLPD